MFLEYKFEDGNENRKLLLNVDSIESVSREETIEYAPKKYSAKIVITTKSGVLATELKGSKETVDIETEALYNKFLNKLAKAQGCPIDTISSVSIVGE